MEKKYCGKQLIFDARVHRNDFQTGEEYIDYSGKYTFRCELKKGHKGRHEESGINVRNLTVAQIRNGHDVAYRITWENKSESL
jgi:hypothetical protein